MSVAGRQTLRVLDGSYVLDRPADVTDVIPRADVLAVVFGPDGSTVMRRNDAGEDAWSALWNGDEAHDLQATGMLSAIVAPLACRCGWFRVSTATSSSSRPIGWMRLPGCCRRPATKSGGNRDAGRPTARVGLACRLHGRLHRTGTVSDLRRAHVESPPRADGAGVQMERMAPPSTGIMAPVM